MKRNEQQTPKEVADACEMLAQQATDDGDSESASLFMDHAHALRRVLKTLYRLNLRVHSGYSFNADPDGMTLEVGAVLDGYTPPNAVRSTTPRCEAFPIGSRWRTYHGEEITVTMYYESTPGCWRLCFDGPNGTSGHMGQNHIARLTPLDAPPAPASPTEGKQ